jgi:hypothetical protein
MDTLDAAEEKYFRDHQLASTLNDLVLALMKDKPPNPLLFTMRWLQTGEPPM